MLLAKGLQVFCYRGVILFGIPPALFVTKDYDILAIHLSR
jgi:hypothetical protein